MEASVVKITLTGHTARDWHEQTVRNAQRMERAIHSGARDMADMILQLGRENIASAGNFTRNWIYGLQTEVEENKFGATIDLGHRYWFARIHEYGGKITPKSGNLLWIPLSFATDAKGVWARDYNRYEGGLFRVNREASGKRPLLMSIRDKQPKYFGIESVTIPKRWSLRDISRAQSKRFGDFYNKYIQD